MKASIEFMAAKFGEQALGKLMFEVVSAENLHVGRLTGGYPNSGRRAPASTEKIIEMWRDGLSMSEIAKRGHLPKERVAAVLRRDGL